MAQVARLSFHESPGFDRAALEALRAEIGHAAAERLIGHTFDELGEALAELTAAYRAGDRGRVAALVAPLVDPAERIGMSTLARVAGDVVALHDRDGGMAFMAAAARLIRLVEGSLTEVCAAPDMIV